VDGAAPLQTRMVSTMMFSGAPRVSSSMSNVSTVWPSLASTASPQTPVDSFNPMDRHYFAEDKRVEDCLFPQPPTLADIIRMEPELSPVSMQRRASDCYESALRPVFEEGMPSKTRVAPIKFSAPTKAVHSAEGAKYGSIMDPKAIFRAKMRDLADFIVTYLMDMVHCGDLPLPS
jgi:hypothetical protein